MSRTQIISHSTHVAEVREPGHTVARAPASLRAPRSTSVGHPDRHGRGRGRQPPALAGNRDGGNVGALAVDRWCPRRLDEVGDADAAMAGRLAEEDGAGPVTSAHLAIAPGAGPRMARRPGGARATGRARLDDVAGADAAMAGRLEEAAGPGPVVPVGL